MKSSRLWELDTLRGVAIVQMVIFHFMWDVAFLGLYPVDILGDGWQNFARLIATQFTFILGVSQMISYTRASQHYDRPAVFKQAMQRAGKLFGCGLIITIATYFFIGSNGFVVFGILHMLGFSILLCYPFLGRNKWLSLGVGVAMLFIGWLLSDVYSLQPWLLWAGVKQYGRSMVDYYPVFPWSGVALIGLFGGYLLYDEGGQRRFSLPAWGGYQPLRGLQFLGRHSLLIYLLHQPILFALLGVISMLFNPLS